jgi:hypothetical protein
MITAADNSAWLSNDELTDEHKAIIFESRLRESFTAHPVDRSINKLNTPVNASFTPNVICCGNR